MVSLLYKVDCLLSLLSWALLLGWFGFVDTTNQSTRSFLVITHSTPPNTPLRFYLFVPRFVFFWWKAVEATFIDLEVTLSTNCHVVLQNWRFIVQWSMIADKNCMSCIWFVLLIMVCLRLCIVEAYCFHCSCYHCLHINTGRWRRLPGALPDCREDPGHDLGQENHQVKCRSLFVLCLCVFVFMRLWCKLLWSRRGVFKISCINSVSCCFYSSVTSFISVISHN